MLRFASLWACLGALGAILVSTPDASAQAVRVGGTGAANELMAIVARAWAAHTPGASVELIPGLGSSGGIAAAADGAIDVAISGRALKSEEKAKGLLAIEFARTPFVLATSQMDVSSLTKEGFAAFYASTASTWPNGTPVRAVIRPKSESDTLLLTSLFPGMADALTAMRARGDIPIAATDQDNLDLAERVPGSLVASSLAQIINEKRNLRVVPIDGVTPTLTAAETGAYNYFKSLYLVAKADTAPAVQALIGFLRTPAGEATLRSAIALPTGE